MKSASDVAANYSAPRQQQTIGKMVSVQGRGYWSGNPVQVRFEPAEVDSGIVFVREDMPGKPEIPAWVDYRVEVPRRTNLVCNGATVEMVEHILAALAGLQVDNCRVVVDAAEMPGMDGSSLGYVEQITEAGIVLQNAPRAVLRISEIVRVGDETCWVEARPYATGKTRLKYRLDFGPSGLIGRETFECILSPGIFASELASSRTFLLLEEAEWLRQQGLGTHVDLSDLLVFGPEGPIDNELRFEDECVRHKMLDLVGDLALAGCDIHGDIIANRSGHRLNAELVRELLRENQVAQFARRTA